jgi:hypothetical protein
MFKLQTGLTLHPRIGCYIKTLSIRKFMYIYNAENNEVIRRTF